MDRLFAALYDRIMAPAEEAGLAELRAEVCAGARGRVLELGAGTGLNLPHYPHDDLEALVLTEPEAPMARRLEDRAAGAAPSVQVVRAPAERLPFADDSFDTVVSTLVLCTVRDPAATLAEIRRVLAPGGSLRLLEHVRSGDPRRARTQDRVQPVWRFVAGGCHCNRATPELLSAAGYRTQLRDHHFPKAPPWVQPLVVGTATP
jgi:SAM-dependent methyltransferase